MVHVVVTSQHHDWHLCLFISSGNLGVWLFAGSAYRPRSRCLPWLVCCQHIDLWSWTLALFWSLFHCWSERALCIVIAQESGLYSTTHTLRKRCIPLRAVRCTATTMALTSIRQRVYLQPQEPPYKVVALLVSLITASCSETLLRESQGDQS